jgi:hypothetical protein
MAKSLLQRIERQALDSRSSVTDALRHCVALGSQAGGNALRLWASRELRGYGPQDELPDYRLIAAPILVDGAVGFGYVTGQQVHSTDWPDFVREEVDETVRLYQPVAELEAMVERGGAVNLSIPSAGLLAKLYEQQGQSVQRVYWQVSPIAIRGVLDQIRTRLVELVAELRQEASDPEAPSAEEANQAINVVVRGQGHQVNVSAAQTGAGTARAAPTGPRRPWWRTSAGLWTIAGSIAGIVAAIIAWIQLT